LVKVCVAALLGLAAAPGCEEAGKPDAAKDDAKADKKKDDKADKGDKPDTKADKKADGKPAESTRPVSGDAAPSGSANADQAPKTAEEAPKPPVTDPSQQTYPDLAQKIPDSCAEPFVVMATAPNSAGEDYAWTWTRQALLANQQFKVVDAEPTAPGQVTFQLHLASDKFNNAWVLVAKCKDGGTCNKLAAMYKAIVKGAVASPVCGKLPMDLSPATFKKPVLREEGFAQNTLPDKSDVQGQCARLQACSVAMDPPAKAGKEEIGFECQKAPTKFKVDCAMKYPCSEVMKCLEGG
jgi:hypothetical protein